MKLFNKFAAFLLSASMLAGTAATASPTYAMEGSWQKSGDLYWYERPDGTYPENQWEKIDGSWYLFNEAGFMKSGWALFEGSWYFLGDRQDGAMKRGWIKDNEAWYYLDSDGKMMTGWITVDGRSYYLDSSGVMVTGWKTIGGQSYYFGSDGHMYRNTTVDDYRIGEDGVWIPGPVYGEPVTGKVVYLTFDDGPSANTEKVLNVLARYGVQATFFVTGANQRYNSMITRAANEGHVIGLHTYTHDYGQVYASEYAYFQDLNRIGTMVEGLVGYRPTLIRFPGGSSNTVSRNYSTGIMSRLVRAVEEQGYTYFDWNVTSMDAIANCVSASYIIDCSTNHNMEKIILLFHDSAPKTTTPEALPAIIEHYLSRGYQFAGLRPDSFSAHHGVQN